MNLLSSVRRAGRRMRLALSRLGALRFNTMFGTARIYSTMHKRRPMRVLEIDGAYQSATFTDENWCDVPFPYMATFDVAFRATRPPHNLLMLGGGGFVYPKHIVAHHPTARIDVVEIDPTIVDLAREYFYLDALIDKYHTNDTKRLGVVVGDALTYLRLCASKHSHYDAIINDCFAGMHQDNTLTTQEALRLTHDCLAPAGLYLINLLSALTGTDAEPLNELVSELSLVFNYVLAVPCRQHNPEEFDNIVVIATDRNPHLEQALTLFEALEP